MTEARNNHGTMTDNMELIQYDWGTELSHNMSEARNCYSNMTEARNNHGNMTDNMELVQHDRGKESPHNMTDARNHHLNMRQERIYHSNMTDTRNCRNLTMLTLFNHVKTTTWLAIPNQNRHMTDAIRKYQKHHIYVWL